MTEILNLALQANIYLQPIEFILVMITNIINIRILCSRTLRTSPCTYYFLGYAISSIIYTFFVCPTQFLRGFRIDVGNTRIGCKIHLYLIFLPPFIARLMLVLASFDRYCSSSRVRRFYSESTKRTARLIILISTILSAIYMSPMSFMYYFNETTGICSQYSNPLINTYIFSQIIVFYISAPLLMIIFGLLTIINIHQYAVCTFPRPRSSRNRRTEGQLARMLILQMTVHLVLTLPFGIVYSMNALDISTRTPNIIGIRYILVLWQQCDYFMSFFLYVCSGKVYRKELFHLFSSCKRSNQTQIHSIRFKQNGTIRNVTIPVINRL